VTAQSGSLSLVQTSIYRLTIKLTMD
jgi:hypothetical protein